MESALQIRVLGGLHIARHGAPLANFVSNKAPALLVYLAMTQHPHSRDALAALLWGELSDTDAKNNLRQALSNLRKLIEPHLIITRETVEFNPSVPATLDAASFERLLTQSADGKAPIGNHHWQRLDDSPSTIQQLQSAVALYQGDFLAGFFVRDAPEFEEWMLAQRARLRELAVHALHTLTEFHLSRSAHTRAIDYATRLLTWDAWREEAHRQLMLALARSGQRAAALAQYAMCRRILDKELSVEPSAETTKLYERIRAAGEAIQHNLPSQPTSFIGRAQELSQLEAQLLQSDCRLLTVLGVGGVGKTRLALAAAERLWQMGAFLHGVYFVPLSAVHSIEGLLFAIAHALSLSVQGGEVKTQLLNYMREKEVLLVLDNFEQLVNTADVLVEVLRGAPQVKLLVTSRERLNIQWEWVFAVNGLTYPEGEWPRDVRLEAWSAVQLFVERARRVLPAFALTESEAAPIVHLCRSVEGMPLALELAAAWLPTHSPATIASEIERSLDFLATTLRDVPARQRSLRAVFTHSWELLDERQRALFAQLSVFHNGFTDEAAQFVAGAAAVALKTLADMSLLRVDTTHAPRRYEMHELMRQFAREKLNTEPATLTGVQRRHSQFFARFAAARQAALKGANHKSGLDDMTREFENVRAGWEWAWYGAELPIWDDIQAYMEPLFVTLEMRGQFAEGEKLFGEAAQRFESGEATTSDTARYIWGQVLIRCGWFYFRMGQFTQATELVERGLPLLRAHHAEAEIAYAYLFLGASAYGQGKLADAKQLFYESYRRYVQLGDDWGSSGASSNIGEVALVMGEFVEAERTLQESLRRARTIDNRHHVAHTLNTLGELATRRQEFDRAEQYLIEALTIARQDGEAYLAALTLSHLAQAVAPHAPTRALELAQEAELALRRFGDRLSLIPALQLLGDLERARKDYSAAKRYVRDALTIAQEIGAAALLPELLYSVACIESDQAQLGFAYELATFLQNDSHASIELQAKAQQLQRELKKRAPTLRAQRKGEPQSHTYEHIVAELLRRW